MATTGKTATRATAMTSEMVSPRDGRWHAVTNDWQYGTFAARPSDPRTQGGQTSVLPTIQPQRALERVVRADVSAEVVGYCAAFRAAATCVTRAPWCFATTSSSAVGLALFCPEVDDEPYGVP